MPNDIDKILFLVYKIALKNNFIIRMSFRQELQRAYARYDRLQESQPGAEETIEALVEVESVIRKRIQDFCTTGMTQTHRLYNGEPSMNRSEIMRQRDEIERRFMKLVGGPSYSIDDLLVQLGEKVQNLLDEVSGNMEQFLLSLGIHVTKISEVILPPEKGEIITGSGAGWEKKEGANRMGMLIDLLRENEIYTDDLNVTIGNICSGIMRESSYAAVWIPRLSRTIFLNNEYGEATFVFHGFLPKEDFLSLGKDAILEKHRGARIVFRDEGAWKSDVGEALYFEIPEKTEKGTKDREKPKAENKRQRKIDIHHEHEIREEILKKYPSPESFMSSKAREKLSFEVYGKGLNAIARIFGVEGDPIGHRIIQAKLAEKIYGKGHEAIEAVLRNRIPVENETSQEQIFRKAIQEKYPTPESFMSLKFREKLSFKIYGKGLGAIARIFGVEGNPNGCRIVQAELGKKIYGEGHEVIEAVLRNNISVDNEISQEEIFRKAIEEQYPTLESFMSLKVREKLSFRVYGKGIIAIVRIFGVTGDPIGNRIALAELAEKIYGKGHEAIEAVLRNRIPVENETSQEEIFRKAIEEQYPTPESFMSLNYREKFSFKIYGKGLRAIARIFGVEGSPVDRRIIQAELAEKIYGKGHEAMEKVLHEKGTQ